MVILDFLQVDLHSGYNLFWGMTLDSSSKPLIELVLFIYLLCRFVMFFTLKTWAKYVTENAISEVLAYLGLTI